MTRAIETASLVKATKEEVRPLPPTLQGLTLFSKYASLRRVADSLDANANVKGTSFTDPQVIADVDVMNISMLDLKSSVENLRDLHKEMFLKMCPHLLDENKEPTSDYMAVFLSVIYLNDGDLTACLSFANDVLSILNPDQGITERLEGSIQYLQGLISDQMIIPKTFSYDEDGEEIDAEDEGTLSLSNIKLALSETGLAYIKDVVDDITYRDSKASTVTTTFDLTKLSLMDSESPSKMLN